MSLLSALTVSGGHHRPARGASPPGVSTNFALLEPTLAGTAFRESLTALHGDICTVEASTRRLTGRGVGRCIGLVA